MKKVSEVQILLWFLQFKFNLEEETEDEDGDKNTDEEQAESDKIKTVQHKPDDEVSKEWHI